MQNQRHTRRLNGGTAASYRAARGGNAGAGRRANYANAAAAPQAETKRAYERARPAPAGQQSYAPTPWDSGYEQAVSAARSKYNNTMTGLGLQRTATEQDYGLAPGYNDYQSNPYSRAALLESSFQRANRGSLNSYAASGQLYAGSLSNALGGDRSSYDRNRDSLSKAYRDALQEIGDRETGAANDKGEAENEAYWRRVEGAEKEPLEPMEAPEPGGRGRKGRQRSYRQQNHPRRGHKGRNR